MQIPSRDIISSVSLFSILGVLIRLGLEELGLQSNDDFVIANLESEQIIDNASGVLVTPIYFDFLSNVFGCFLMGIFVAQQSWMKQRQSIFGATQCIYSYFNFPLVSKAFQVSMQALPSDYVAL